MAIIPYSRSRRQDHRGSTSPGSPSGLDRLETIQREESAHHDRWVADLGHDTLLAIWKDLAGKPCYDRRNPEHRWVMGRRAAVGRRLTNEFSNLIS